MEVHQITVNPADPAFKNNPYEVYAALQKAAPVHRVQMPNGHSFWIVTRYDDAITVLKDARRFGSNYQKLLPPEELAAMAQAATAGQNPMRLFQNILLNIDPPDHTRLRALVSKAFTPRMVEGLQPRIQALADAFLDQVQARAQGQTHGHMDLIDDYAFLLPIAVISEMLGVPYADRDKFRAWSNAVTSLSDNPQDFQKSRDAIAGFFNYISRLVEEKRHAPQDDLVSAMVQAEVDGQKLSNDDLYSMIVLLLIAGHETTVNLIGNGMLALMQHPEQLSQLQQNPELIKPAIEEILRYNGPVEWSTTRWVLEDLTLGGKQLHRGEQIFVVLNAGDHDPSHFNDPDSFDILRERNTHLAFGHGIHYCLGAPLARLEGQIAIGTLLRRMPNIQLDASPDSLTWRPSMFIRGLTSLPVTF